MAVPDSVPKGKSYNYTFKLQGKNLTAFTYTMQLKKYPEDTPAISRAVVPDGFGLITDSLTSAETSLLDVGLWHMIVKSEDADESIESTKRIQVTSNWS